MRLILRNPGSQEWWLDTPDPALVGPWLKAIFDSFGEFRDPIHPIEFTLEIR